MNKTPATTNASTIVLLGLAAMAVLIASPMIATAQAVEIPPAHVYQSGNCVYVTTGTTYFWVCTSDSPPAIPDLQDPQCVGIQHGTTYFQVCTIP